MFKDKNGVLYDTTTYRLVFQRPSHHGSVDGSHAEKYDPTTGVPARQVYFTDLAGMELVGMAIGGQVDGKYGEVPTILTRRNFRELEGRLLTLVDAMFMDSTHREAFKTVLRTTVREFVSQKAAEVEGTLDRATQSSKEMQYQVSADSAVALG